MSNESKPSPAPSPPAVHGHALGGRAARLSTYLAGLDPTVRGMLWTVAAGMLFSVLNTLLRLMAQQMDPFQAQFLRYLFGCIVMIPIVLRTGLAAYWPKRMGGQFLRGGFHTIGLCLWFTALPQIHLADMTAIGFTGPIFIMIGAFFFFKEKMLWDRWLAAAIGFAGVLVVVWPKLSGGAGFYHMVMLASAPMFAMSFLCAKFLTRHERPEVIVVWLAITVAIFSFPLATLHWTWPTASQWLTFLVCGVIGSAGHYCLTRSFVATDISATQSVKFLDLVWASAMGWLVFAAVPSATTLAGGVVIAASTVWIARREARARKAA